MYEYTLLVLTLLVSDGGQVSQTKVDEYQVESFYECIQNKDSHIRRAINNVTHMYTKGEYAHTKISTITFYCTKQVRHLDYKLTF